MPRKKEEDASGESFICIGYKDYPHVKQDLFLLAAKERHGSVSRVIREAVREYLKRHRKKIRRDKSWAS